MTKKEALAIYKVMKNSYPNVYKDFKENDINGFVDLWIMMFEEESIEIVIQGLKSVVQNIEYPPTIAHVKKAIKAMQLGGKTKYPTEEEAWDKVQKAMTNSSYNSVEEFNKLDDITKKLIGSHNVLKEYGLMDVHQTNTVIKSNFMRSYRSVIQQKMEFDNLPSSAKKLSKELSCNEQFKLEDKEVAGRSIEERNEKV